MPREKGETIALEDGEDAHGEKHTTHLSRERDGCAPLRVNGSGGKARGLMQDLAYKATPALAVTLGLFAQLPSCQAWHERGHLKYRIIPSKVGKRMRGNDFMRCSLG